MAQEEGSGNRSLLRRLIEAVLDRNEQKFPPMMAHATAAQARNNADLEAGKQWNTARSDPEALIPTNDKLLIFRALTGIDSVPALTQGGHLLRSAPNVGIYTRVVRNEGTAKRAYTIFNWLINICLSIQIVVAAAVTAVGAASGPHAAVTAFGAINTIMAGILTYLRGTGLPDTMKAYENKWKRIREYIEQREREFCLVGCDLDVQEEVFIVESMYQSLRAEMETSRNSGDTKAVQPDDPRIRRSLLPAHNELSGHHPDQTITRRSEALSPSGTSHIRDEREAPVSPVAIPERVLDKQ
ncbi:hypothetical protein N7468_005812 [Penicillium chermesinum]|uniref:SMODS and SLOG-associating 2TM effector domain-containing protein n=1 Tax=Penicillium chermesinum TaxID=63820 RepID=A0A9W9P094_9EURO|nr:uncharacterized protein N7468_005812 [Penicillium chermesinum]KAJ5232856.1 hypothetical protein N7468_005812 [Penicillium chermesinum]KAJ6172506.1 hypothetical protein N7470_001573 [Penicillium chermesinum]